MYRVERGTLYGLSSYTLTDTDSGVSAGILPERGALLCSLTLHGEERIYVNPENLVSTERPRCGMPVLFPLCGRVKNDTVTIDGACYPMQIHGFAHTSPFQVLEARADGHDAHLFLQLVSSDATRCAYPFDFSLQLSFSLQNGALSVTHAIRNTGSGIMPCHFGYHPYFLMDSLSDSTVTVPGREPIRLPEPDPVSGESGSFVPASGDATLWEGSRNAGVSLHFTGNFGALVLWSIPEKGFLCVEPWQGMPNGTGIQGGPLLAPGEEAAGMLSLRPISSLH